jgi:ABC-type antimicrobial peptide transport system permease subunit
MKKEVQPPAWIDALIENFSPSHLAEEIRGDLYELYLKDLQRRDARFAGRMYVMNGLGFLLKSFFWQQSTHDRLTAPSMITNYFKMAKRSLLAQKGTTAINIVGLVVGIASALVIFFVINFELSFDTFHSKADQIYRLVRVSGQDMSEYRTGISYPVPPALVTEAPALKKVVAVEHFGGADVDVMNASGHAVAQFREERGLALMGSDFFELFDFKDSDFKWRAGDQRTALDEPFTVVLTSTMAKKYFGEADPLGKTLRLQKRLDFKVTGVIDDFPANTDFSFSVLLSYASLKTLAGDQLENWYSVNDTHCVYVLLEEGTTKQQAAAQIAKVHAAHTPKELHEFRHYLLQPLSDVHYDTRFGNFSRRTISRQTISALGIVAVFLLLTGCINYINLATAQSSLRSKEVGLRKVMGSNRKNLLLQFLMETFIVVLVAGTIALVFSEIFLANLQGLLNIKHTQYIFTNTFVLLCLAGIVLAVTFFAGLYPAIAISKFSPLNALKNKFSTEYVGGLSLRKTLVVIQFTITQMLVVGTFIVVGQMRYFQTVEMGFDPEAIVTMQVSNVDRSLLPVLEEQLRSQSFVKDVSYSFTLPSGVRRNRSYQDIGSPEANSMEDFLVFEYMSIDQHYLDLYDIKLLAGRNLAMSDSIGNILINKSLAKNLELGTPIEAVGKTLKGGDGKLLTVAGVVDDFYSNSMKESVDYLVMFISPDNYHSLSIKLDNSTNTSFDEKITSLSKIWRTVAPDLVFTYDILDENIAAFYEQEKKYAQMFQLFSGVFLVIGCLGLYGLITFIVYRKGKEIAVRKVLGASVGNILLLFSKEYIQLVVISFLLAVPVAYYVVDSWLSNFINRIELKWWLFLVPGLTVLLLALLVVGLKSLNAANANPVDRLKYE